MKLQEWLNELEKTESAILATNFYNFETLSGVVQAAAESGSEIILQTSPSTVRYLGVDMAVAMARAALREYNVQGWLHLDHTESFDLIKTCLDAGYDSVMIDASVKPFSENVAITSKVTKLAHMYGASVEAELGYVPKLGQSQENSGFTDPEEAKDTFMRTLQQQLKNNTEIDLRKVFPTATEAVKRLVKSKIELIKVV